MELAKKAAVEAGNLITNLQGRTQISEKTTNNLVTQADLDSERLIRSLIAGSFPDTDILGEEEAGGTVANRKLWIVDPLDGTNNYAHGIPLYCVSIAYAEDGVVKAGVVYDPNRNELFSAIKGEGAFLNDTPIHASHHASLRESIIVTGFHYDRGTMMKKTLQALYRLFKANIRGMRRTGTAALDLCWVACGRFDAYFEYILSPWDYAAGALIATEAGGVCSDREGRELTLSTTGVICSNQEINRELTGLVSWNYFSEVNDSGIPD